eukprot:1945435-Amphidinium_carterae.1
MQCWLDPPPTSANMAMGEHLTKGALLQRVGSSFCLCVVRAFVLRTGQRCKRAWNKQEDRDCHLP